MQITQPESFYSTTLASSINATQSTIPVTTAPNITVGYMVIESNTANREIISYTGVTGTTLTGVTRGLASYGSNTSAGTGKAHAAGTDIANRNVHYYYAQYYDFLTGTSATGYNTMKIGDGGTCSASNRIWSVPLSSYTPWWGLSANGRMVVSEDGTNSYVISAGGSGIAAGNGVSIVGGTLSVDLLSTGGISLSANKLTIGGNYYDAMSGTSGTPSSTNKYVTNDTVTSAKTALHIPIRDANSDILVATTPTADDAATSKTYVDAGGTYKSGTFNRAWNLASATQNIAHNLGTTPTYVRITGSWADGATAYGHTVTTYNGTTQSSISTGGLTTNVWNTTTFRYGDKNSYQEGVITFDATNIIITWTRVGSSTNGDGYFMWEAKTR